MNEVAKHRMIENARREVRSCEIELERVRRVTGGIGAAMLWNRNRIRSKESDLRAAKNKLKRLEGR